MCAPSIVVRDAAVVEQTFDARRSATARRYRYTVLNTPAPNPLLANRVWHVPDPLDLNALRLGCDPLIGSHDFSSFCRKPKVAEGVEPPSMVRDVHDARWHDLGDGLLRFDIEASSFCQQMVRAIVGTLVDMGLGKRTAGEMRGILEARTRSAASGVAPPHGLVLWEVLY
jgi:tRNA pseudouridine38-40 synthase